MTKGDTLLKRALKELKKDKPNIKNAFLLLEESALQNNYEALYAIGTWYLHGKYVKKNRNLAVKYFIRAIEGNNRNAFFDLAVCYEKGTGVKMSNKKAFECYLNAALLGDRQAIYEVGRCYYYGIGISKNMRIGLIWIQNANLNGITS
jgi:TPR repeat protein